MAAIRIDRETFLAHVRESGLVSTDQLASVADQLPVTPRARLVARALVQHGLLTKFQAELLLAGRTRGFFVGRYRILDQLGQGGMGRVFKAVHETMNRVVALKLVSSGLVRTERARQMFQREVLAAGRLMHPNIVTAYDANEIGDRQYLVLEFVDGPNLEQLVRERGPLPIEVACDVIRQAAHGLQYASEIGMVHRDIKPGNLLVQKTDGGRLVKILDFGLARFHDPSPDIPGGAGTILVRENTVTGTPDFVSPEQARSVHDVDIRSDLYSLGCTFYYLLTGKVPFPGGSVVKKLVRHATEEPLPVEQLRPEVPPALGGIIRKLMAKDPGDRFQTPAALATALEPFTSSGAAEWVVPDHAETVVEPLDNAADADPALSPTLPGPGDDAVPFGELPVNLATPLSIDSMPSLHLRRAVQSEHQRRLKIAVFVAIGIVCAVLALCSWLLLRPQ
jgi:serine/threonine protein kinase